MNGTSAAASPRGVWAQISPKLGAIGSQLKSCGVNLGGVGDLGSGLPPGSLGADLAAEQRAYSHHPAPERLR